MGKIKRVHILSGVLVAMAIAAAIFFAFTKPGAKPPPSDSGYYTGPMKNKSGRNEFATEEGKLVAPPAGAAQDTKGAENKSADEGAKTKANDGP